jgi:beta-phosphoglucomutase-like phosphatase (HAD superfamily)
MEPRETHMLVHELVPGPHIRCLLFDCDGTLVDTLGAYQQAWTAPFAGHGFTLTDEWFTSQAGLSADPFIRAALPHVSDEVLREVEDEGFASFLAQTHLLETFDHVVDIARAYHGVLPLAVVSSGRRDAVTATLEAVRITELFEHVITVDDVAHGKPAPDGYLLALERLGVTAAECLAYEDSGSGIAAAEAAGIAVLDVRGTG